MPLFGKIEFVVTILLTTVPNKLTIVQVTILYTQV